MVSLESSIATSMDCFDNELVAFLPFILQDFWEFGSPAEPVLRLIEKYGKGVASTRFLDLGCGKGSVSIQCASRFGCRCLGIDGVADFIQEAKSRAEQNNVAHLCEFITDDIRTRIDTLPAVYYDIIFLGSIGPILGDYATMLTRLKKILKDDGCIVVDDGYIEEGSGYRDPRVFSKREILRQIDVADMRLAEIVIPVEKEAISEEYAIQLSTIIKRCSQLIERHPEKKPLFEWYMQKQKKEYNALENEIVCATFVIQKSPFG